MHLGKDFWFIVWLLKVIIRIFEELGKDNNEDTEKGQL